MNDYRAGHNVPVSQSGTGGILNSGEMEPEEKGASKTLTAGPNPYSKSDLRNTSTIIICNLNMSW